MTTAPPEVSAAFIAAASASMAAAIAGIFSLAGLFISKEQDTSRFRQAWIDELRKDIASLAARAHQIHAYVLLALEEDNAKRWQATHDDFIELNSASMRIKLRLNPGECESRLVLEQMNQLEDLFKEIKNPLKRDNASLDKIFSIIDGLERDAPPLLKKEWERVKSGEPVYRTAKIVAVALSLVSLAIAVFFFYKLLH